MPRAAFCSGSRDWRWRTILVRPGVPSWTGGGSSSSVVRAHGEALLEAELHRALDRDAHDSVHRVDPLGLVQELLLARAHDRELARVARFELGAGRRRAELAHRARALAVLLLDLVVDAL